MAQLTPGVLLLACTFAIVMMQAEGGGVPEFTWLDKISPVAEHLTVVTVLLFIIGALLREWLMVGATCKTRIKEAQDTAVVEIKRVRDDAAQQVMAVQRNMQSQLDRQQLDFQRQLADLQRQYDQGNRDKDAEMQRLRMEVDRVQAREQDWQQISLGALGGLDRQGRMLERGLIQPLEQRLRLQVTKDVDLPPGNNG